MPIDEENWRNETLKMKLEWLYKICSKCELNSWPHSAIGWICWTNFRARVFKSYAGEISVATFKNLFVVNTIYINSLRHTLLITYARFSLTYMWWLRKAMAKVKLEHWTKDQIEVLAQLKLDLLHKVRSKFKLNFFPVI